MQTFLYYNISEFAVNPEGVINKGTYKIAIYNTHKFGRKSQFSKSTDVSMLGHGCGVSQYP